MALSRKTRGSKVPKIYRKHFAEGTAEGGSKKDYSQDSRKVRGRLPQKGIDIVVKLYRNKIHGSHVVFICASWCAVPRSGFYLAAISQVSIRILSLAPLQVPCNFKDG